MNILKRIQINRSIHKLCVAMVECMTEEHVMYCAYMIRDALGQLPGQKKDTFIDYMLEVIEDERRRIH